MQMSRNVPYIGPRSRRLDEISGLVSGVIDGLLHLGSLVEQFPSIEKLLSH